jgi:hypothetical protein
MTAFDASSALMSTSRTRGRRAALTVLIALALATWTAAAHAQPLALSFTNFTAGAINADGTPATQAGAHPFELTTSFAFATIFSSEGGTDVPTAALKDTVLSLPPGAIGNPGAVPQCLEQELATPIDNCPRDTQVGIADVDVKWFFGRTVFHEPVYSVVPPAGTAAEFRFVVTAAVVHIAVKVRTGGDYGVTATSLNANTAAPLYGVTVHLWGVPADPAHDTARGGPSGLPRKPFLRNPTSCTGPTTTAIHADSW